MIYFIQPLDGGPIKIGTTENLEGRLASLSRLGLSDTDSDALRAMCEESGDDYATAEAQVLSWVRRRTADLTARRDTC